MTRYGKPFCLILMALGISILIGACAPWNNAYVADRPISKETIQPIPKGMPYPNFPSLGDELVASLLESKKDTRALQEGLWLVTTFSDVGDLERSTEFGRALQETVMSALIKRGFLVKEARVASKLKVIRKKGEFLLARSLEDLRGQVVGAQFVLIGTFSETPSTVIVNARVLDFNSGTTLLATSKEIVKTPVISGLLEESKGMEPTVVDRLIQ